jgi:AMIN domain-containing protein
MTKRRVGIVRRVLTSALVLLLLPIGTAAGAQTPPGIELRDVSVTTQPDSVTIVVKTTGEVKYQAELVDHPYRLVLDFDDTSYAWRKAPMAVQAEPLKQIRGSQYRRGVARVVLELTRKVGYAIREENDGLAIVIPTAPSARLTEPAAKPPVAVTAKPVPAAKPPAAKTPSAAVRRLRPPRSQQCRPRHPHHRPRCRRRQRRWPRMARDSSRWTSRMPTS